MDIKRKENCGICCSQVRRLPKISLDAPSPPLPNNRIRISATFIVTGVDLAIPVFTRSKDKCWIMIFTFAVYNLIQSYSISLQWSFIQGLRRFIERRGRISVIYSDIVTNFTGVNAALKQLDWNQIQKETNLHNIDWKFIPSSAP
ncbi:hypothetical protein AVEN_167949-1 [Araneus ventricosus]|uniref:Uncharacterized protein n=1 Tax=Araneus ventricosus TaxID=182803 RepID=A0A4Y2E223_ARAVE|nr:hypothetical protein AVEN_90210-1 [Araneus ventricosus]GBM23132.1 hypothetical protein AVEN_167949-1 [Araneus ventricosus]